MTSRKHKATRLVAMTTQVVGATLMYWGAINLFIPLGVQQILPNGLFLPTVAAIIIMFVGFVVVLRGFRAGESWLRLIETLVGVNRAVSPSLSAKTLGDLTEAVTDLRRSLSGGNVSLAENVQNQILELYREALSDKLTHDLSSQLRILISEQFKRDTETEAARFLAEVNGRLQAASSTVTVRGFLNLVLGIGFAVGALIILQQAVSVLTPERLNTMPISTAIYLTAIRVSLALVLTLVAYFFLALYKRSLDDAKYYQNEMTDLSSKATALQLAYNQGDSDSRNLVLTKLMDSDRNGLLGTITPAPSTDPIIGEIAKGLLDKLPSIKA